MSAKTSNPKKPAHGRWEKGISGNPAGRPPGSRNKSTVFFEEILHGQGEALIQKGIDLSLQGDTRALGICWDRLLPVRRERTIGLPLPRVSDAKGVAAALESVVSAVAEGRITPGEAECLARVLATHMRVVEFEALAQRVAELEKVQTGTPQGRQPSGSTLEWIAHNYSNPIPDSGMTAQEHRDRGDGDEANGQEEPPQAPGISTSPAEITR